jgi:hypothetical protein
MRAKHGKLLAVGRIVEALYRICVKVCELPAFAAVERLGPQVFRATFTDDIDDDSSPNACSGDM